MTEAREGKPIMMTSLYSAVSGLSNHQTLMDVIGDNIANINTIGFKASRASFATSFAQLLASAGGPTDTRGGTNPIEIGLGMRISSIDRMFEQGNFESTGNRTDLAIQGDGFFVVGEGSSRYFTRSGNFQLDSDGSLLAGGGRLHVLGRLADVNGNLSQSSSLEPLRLPFGEKDPAKATTEISYSSNLDAGSSKTQTFTASLAFTEDSNAATAASEINNLDQVTAPLDDGDTITIVATNQQGNAVNVTFTYGAANDGTTLGSLINKINAATGFDSASPTGSTLSMDASGKLVLRDNRRGESQTTISMSFTDVGGSASTMSLPTFVQSTEGVTGTHSNSTYVYDSRGERHKIEVTFTQDVTQSNVWTWEATVDDGLIDAANNQLAGNTGTVSFAADGSLVAFEGGPLSFTPTDAQGMSINLSGGTAGTANGITQFAAPSTTVAVNQDGHSMGVLQDFSVDGSGQIIGSYSNGTTRTLGQIAIARFANASGLSLAGENAFSATANSGDAVLGYESGTANQIYSGYLELSTVDLAKQFTDMIIAQRGYQANARVITVADQLLNEVTQLKR
jgi:flagellar hook protein FlgE